MNKLNRNLIPVPSELKSFSLPDISTIYLKNGLKVICVEKTELPIIQTYLVSNCGSKFDPQDKKGLANLFSMCIDEGAGDLNALELSDRFEMLGTDFSVSSSSDSFLISMMSLKDNFEKSFELFSLIVTRPEFGENNFIREKNKILTALAQLKDEPSQIAAQIFPYNLFGKENIYAYPSYGYESTIKQITVDDIKNFYKEYFSPSNSFVILVGDMDTNSVERIMNKTIGHWEGNLKDEPKISVSKNKLRKVYLYNKPHSVQSEIILGHISGKKHLPEYFQKLVLNKIFGGGFSSRINKNLREEKGFTYGASSNFGYYKNAGFFSASTSVNIENTANAVNEILIEMENIGKSISPKELSFAKSSIIKQFPSGFETYKQVARNLISKEVFSLPDDYFDNFIRFVSDVQLNDLLSLAGKFIDSGNVVINVVGDKEKLKNQLKNIKADKFYEVDLKGEIISEI